MLRPRPNRCRRVNGRCFLGAAADHMRFNLDVELLEDAARNRGSGYSCCRFARRCTLEYVADVVVQVFESAGEIGVAGDDACVSLFVDVVADSRHGHRVGPVGEVFVFDPHRDG